MVLMEPGVPFPKGISIVIVDKKPFRTFVGIEKSAIILVRKPTVWADSSTAEQPRITLAFRNSPEHEF